MTGVTQSALLGERRFAPFFWTQFLGAFNDNMFKNALLILLAYHGLESAGGGSDVLINVAAALFILPFFLFSAVAGQLADKHEKSMLMRRIKLAEVGIALLVCLGFWLDSMPFLIGVLFLLGTQAAAFGPVKYAVLPQVLGPDELIAGNGLVEMGTFVAILCGTVLGGVLIAQGALGRELVAGGFVLLAVAGYLVSRRIPPAAAASPGLAIRWNPLPATIATLRAAAVDRTVFNSIVGISWFWFFGAMFLTQMPNYTRQILAGNEAVGTLLLATFSIGIGVGALLCDRLSDHKVELGLVPFGSLGLSLFAIDLYFAVPAAVGGGDLTALVGFGAFLSSPHGLRVLFDVFMISAFGGFFIVPLYAIVQQRSAPDQRSRIIAANNVLNALAMVVAAVAAALMLGWRGLNIAELFLVTALMNAVVALYIYSLVPEFLMRFIVWMLVHTVHRARKRDLDRIPAEGAAIVVCNHVSFADALILMGCVRRPMRFVMHHAIFKLPLLSFVFRHAKAIPIAPAKEDPAMLDRAMDEIAAALAAGELVCVFPEGGLTPDGELQPFRPGIERIVQRSPVPVVPLALRGMWGTMSSRKGGPAFLKLPRGFRTRIELVAGLPVPASEVTAAGLQQLVGALRGDLR